MKISVLISVFAFAAGQALGQPVAIPLQVKEILLSSCRMCHSRQQQTGFAHVQILYPSPCENAYHLCHLFYNTNQLDSAYVYALQVSISAHLPEDSRRVLLAAYVKAKVLVHKQLYKEALDDFLALVNNPSLDPGLRVNIYPNIGEIYLLSGNSEAALRYFTVCLRQYRITDTIALRNVYTNLASCYVSLDQVKTAQTYFSKSIAISRQLKDTFGIAMSFVNAANQYYGQYRDRLAAVYFRKGLSYALRTNDDKLKQTAFLNMSVLSENRKDYRSALIYRKSYDALLDTLYNRENIWNLALEEKKIATQQSEHQIRLTEQENRLIKQTAQLQALALEKKNFQLVTSISISAAFLFFFLFASYAYLGKKKQNRVITAQREELNRLNLTKDQLYSVIAHDLRSPVLTMKLALDRLKNKLFCNDLSGAGQVTADIETISNNTYSLLNNLLYWILGQTGQLRFAKEKLNLRALTDGVLYDYTPVAGIRHVRLENQIADQICCVGDPNTIRIILRNLIDNAIKFSDPDSSVCISAGISGDECVLSVADSGTGIDTKVLEALNDGQTKRLDTSLIQSGSSGIGFWLIKTMTQGNGGRLQIDKLIKGTKISICLPPYPGI